MGKSFKAKQKGKKLKKNIADSKETYNLFCKALECVGLNGRYKYDKYRDCIIEIFE